ncbi:hypothetical protein Q5P01_012690 [Channa striata]|uniref:Uncharacterized protein n=1 Tax=Channa striata TaxID=64152 RepID=A0AA88MQ93_CHASR|nr:hypothetical protein Q5P01_012690 [Channa striata]
MKLQCAPRADDEHFDQLWCREMLHVRQFSSASAASERRRRRHRTGRSQLLLVTPVHPEQIDIETLANSQNHFNIVEFEGRRFVRVTSSVSSPDERQSQRIWRVSDYSLRGRIILSVIFSMTMDTMQQWRRRGLSEP